MMKKIRKWWNNRILNNFILLFISFILLELIFRLIDNLPILNVASIRIILFCVILSLFFGYIFSFLPRLINKIGNLIIILIYTIYGLAELGFHNYLGVYASISTNTQLGAVSSYLGDFLHSLKPSFYLLFLPFGLLLLYYIFLAKLFVLNLPKKKSSKLNIFLKTIPIWLILIFSALYYGTLKASFMQDQKESTTAYELFLKPTNSSLVIRNFGFINYSLLDIKEYFFPGKIINEIEINHDDLKSQTEISEHQTIANSLWLDLIAMETDKELNSLNHYFISQDIATTNDYTGLFSGKNLIVIMVESANDIIFEEEYYPNIARLTKNGYTFSNNYSPRNICSTGNNEMSSMISLYSINNNCTANVYQTNTYFESIFNLFNNEGYITNSFHDYYDWYYNRKIIHTNMGSKTYYDAIDLELPFSYNYGAYNTWASDELLMVKYLEVLDSEIKEEPFMSFITTVSSHQPYNSSEFGDMYMDLFPTTYSSELKRYMSKLKVVDNAIGILLDGLEARGILDDTVIVLFGDHYPYAIDQADLNLALDYDVSLDNNADQVPLIIYNSQIDPEEFFNYTSYIDILPTIANLFDLDYDSRLYMGNDILSDDYNSLVIFNDGSWKNEYAFYNASTGFVNYYTQKVYSDEEILAINQEVRLKLEMSSLAIRKNYFSYLESSLNSLTTSET